MRTELSIRELLYQDRKTIAFALAAEFARLEMRPSSTFC